MLKQERQEYILHQLNLHNKVLCANLSSKMNVSDDTVRRDLQDLSQEGKLIKVHGGALSKSFHTAFDRDMVYNIEHKNIFAKKTAALVQNGMYILTSGGTSILEFAKSLEQHLNATFFTCSLNAAIEFAHHPSIEVVMIGDKIAKESMLATSAKLPASTASTATDILTEIYRNRCIELFMSGLKLEDMRKFGRATTERKPNFFPYPFKGRDCNPNTPADPSF